MFCIIPLSINSLVSKFPRISPLCCAGPDTLIFVCGPPGQMNALSGNKVSPSNQGELKGALADLGYTAEQVRGAGADLPCGQLHANTKVPSTACRECTYRETLNINF